MCAAGAPLLMARGPPELCCSVMAVKPTAIPSEQPAQQLNQQQQSPPTLSLLALHCAPCHCTGTWLGTTLHSHCSNVRYALGSPRHLHALAHRLIQLRMPLRSQTVLPHMVLSRPPSSGCLPSLSTCLTPSPFRTLQGCVAGRQCCRHQQPPS